MPRSRSQSRSQSKSPSKSPSRSPTPSQSRSRSRSVATPSPSRRSRSPISEHDNESDLLVESRLHLAELPQGTKESEVRKVFERFGTLTDVWVAGASCFGFVVYKQKDEAQKAIDEMDGKTFGKNRIKVTWARPRTKNRSQRYDPNMRCFKCGIRGHFSRECESRSKDGGSRRRRDEDRDRDRDRDRYASSRSSRHSRSRSSRSPGALLVPAYFRHGMPVYPDYASRRYDDYIDGYHPMSDRSNGHDHRYRDRGTRLTPPSTSARYSRR